MSKYSKFIVSALTAIAAGLSTLTDVSWAPVVASGIGAILVYLVPNKDGVING
jgi:hypothetical protein